MLESFDDLRSWVGRTREQSDIVEPERLAALSATLDRDDPPPADGDPLPPPWHWIFFREAARQSQLGHDGHAARGEFLPPVPLPRRMWAGSRLTFHRAPRVGEHMVQRSEIIDVTPKSGKSGQLVFVVVRHVTSVEGVTAIEEEQDIVYREAPQASSAPAKATAKPAPKDAEWSRTVEPDPVLLFRYSALTFNAHRIHYDLAHCAEEGYPNLVVHGPLLATLLLDLCRRARPEAEIRAFSFRAVAPVFAPEPFTVAGKPGNEDGALSLWAATGDGSLAMQADAHIM